jgi:membrane associated rhomboid family serine protease
MVFVAGMMLAVNRGIPVNIFLQGGARAGGQQDPRDLKRVIDIDRDTGGLFADELVRGPWWQWGRLLTKCFVHGGLLHLGMNMFVLFMLGPQAERLWGRWRFLTLYLLAGLCGSFAALITRPGDTVGASGALCGLIGGEAAWLFVNRRALPPQVVQAGARNLLLNGILIVVMSSMGGVSAADHYGGAAGGILAALLLDVQRFGAPHWRRAAIVGLLAMPVVGFAMVQWNMRHDPAWLLLQKGYFVRDEVRDDLRQHCVTPLRLNVLDVEQTFMKVEPLLKAPGDANKVAALQRELGARREKLRQALQEIDQCGPYQDHSFTEFQLLSRKYVADLDRLMQLSQQALASPKKDMLDTLAAQWKQILQDNAEWKELGARVFGP